MGFRVHRVYRGRNKFDIVIFTTVNYILGQCYFVGARLQFFQCPLLMMKLLGQNAKAIHLYHLFKLSYFHDIIRYKWRHMLFSACTDFRPTAHVNNILPQWYIILCVLVCFCRFVPYKKYWVVHYICVSPLLFIATRVIYISLKYVIETNSLTFSRRKKESSFFPRSWRGTNEIKIGITFDIDFVTTL